MITKKLAAAGAAAALMLVGLSAQPAQARSNDGILRGSGISYGSGGWYGAYHVGDEVAFCGDLGSERPSHADGWTVSKSGYTFYKQTQWSTDGVYPYPTSGKTASAAELAQMSYAMKKYAGSAPNTVTAVALEHFIREHTIDGTAQINREAVRWSQLVVPEVSGAQARYNAIKADAVRNAGPYTAGIEWVNKPAKPGDSGTLRAFIKTGSGAKLLNTPLAVAAVGGSADATKANTGTTGDATITVTPSGVGDVSVSVATSGLTGIWPTLYTPTNRGDNVQRLLGEPTEAHATVSAKATATVTPWTPKATTQTSKVLITGEQELYDTANVSDGKPGAKFEGKSTLYGPFDKEKDLTLDASKIVGVATFSGTFDASGKATVKTTPLTVKAPEGRPAFYVWSEQISKGPDNEETPPAPPTPSETTVSVSPKIKTLVTDQKVLPGQTISDTFTAEGLVASVGNKPIRYTVTGAVYGPAQAVEGSCTAADWKSAPVAAKIEALPLSPTADGTAEVSEVGPFRIPADAKANDCYTYGETLTATVEGQEPVTWNHEPGQESQTAVVEVPAISTKITGDKFVVAPGASISDTIKVTGTADTEGSMDAVLYGYISPEANKQCTTITDEAWRAAIAKGTVTELGRDTIAIKGDGEYVTKEVKLDAKQVGCATWYEKATFKGTDHTVETPHGVETETALVLAPKVITTASADGKYAGASISDVVEITGTHGESGVVTGKVLGPMPGKVTGSTVTCEAVDWTKAPVAGEIESFKIKGDGTYKASKVKTTTDGCYSVTETLTLDRGGIVTVEPAGVPSQTVYLLKPTTPVVNTGDVPGTSGSTTAALAAGGVAVVALSGAALLLVRRRRQGADA